MPSGLIIRGVMLMESHGGRWVSLPSKPYQKPDGTQSWIPFADFTSGEVKERFNSQVLPIAEAAFELSGAR
jgi:hypothetical protein